MHDIEPNPGPRSPKFPCGICRKAVTWRQYGVVCDDYNTWYHTTCMHMSSTIYNALHNISWHCTSCSIPQFSNSFFNSTASIDTSNSFSSLDTSLSYQQQTGGPNQQLFTHTNNTSTKICLQTFQNHQHQFPKHKKQNSRTWQLHLLIRHRHSHRHRNLA